MTRPELRPLARTDWRDGFTSGQASLDSWLTDHAWAAHAGRSARVFCAVENGQIVGYYALSAGAVARESAEGRLARGAPDPVPVVLLARLAVDRSHQGRGLGADLLIDAMARTLQASEQIAARAMVVHAIDAAAAAFYRHHDFQPLADHEHHLYLMLKDVAALFDE